MSTDSTQKWTVSGAESTTQVQNNVLDPHRDIAVTSTIRLHSGTPSVDTLLGYLPGTMNPDGPDMERRIGAGLVTEIRYTEVLSDGTNEIVEKRLKQVEDLIARVFDSVVALLDADVPTNLNSSISSDGPKKDGSILPPSIPSLTRVRSALRKLQAIKEGALSNRLSTIGAICDAIDEVMEDLHAATR